MDGPLFIDPLLGLQRHYVIADREEYEPSYHQYDQHDSQSSCP